jgi:hypothetical protein
MTDARWWLREYREDDGPHYVPRQLSAEQLREGWARAARRFYDWRSMWRRWVTGPQFSWIQRVGFWPLNVMQRRLARTRGVTVPPPTA